MRTTPQLYKLKYPLQAYVLVGTTPSNTWVGASRAFHNVWLLITLHPGVEIHLLPGGDFAVLGDRRFRVALELDRRHLFERGGPPLRQRWDLLDHLDPQPGPPAKYFVAESVHLSHDDLSNGFVTNLGMNVVINELHPLARDLFSGTLHNDEDL